MNKHTEVPCEQRLKKQARIPAGRLMFKNTRMRRLLFKKSGQVFLTQPLFLCFSKTFAIYGLHRASHSRNPTAIRIPGLRPPCSCPLTRSVRATAALRDIRIAPCFALPQSYGHSHSRPSASMLMSVNPFCEKAPLHASMRFAFHIRVISLISLIS